MTATIVMTVATIAAATTVRTLLSKNAHRTFLKTFVKFHFHMSRFCSRSLFLDIFRLIKLMMELVLQTNVWSAVTYVTSVLTTLDRKITELEEPITKVQELVARVKPKDEEWRSS